MKSIALTALGLLLTIASFSQLRPMTFHTDKGKYNDLFKYEVIKKEVHPTEDRTNYITYYCIKTDKNALAWELAIVHDSWNNSITSFLSVNEKLDGREGRISICDNETRMVSLHMDGANLSYTKSLEDGREMIFGDVIYEIKWLDKSKHFLGLNDFANDDLGFTFR